MSDRPVIVNRNGELTEEQLAEFKRRMEKALRKPQRYRVLSLPRRTRLRLWCIGKTDLAAIWLIDHVHWRAGKWLWRLSGLWR